MNPYVDLAGYPAHAEGQRGGMRFELPTPAEEEMGLWVSSVGHLKDKAEDERILDRTLSSHAVTFVWRGSGWFESDSTGRVEVQAGTLLWQFPELRHSYAPGPSGWSEEWALFGGAMADAFCRRGFLDPARAVVPAGNDSRVPALVAKIRNEYLEGGRLSGSLASSLIHQLVVVSYGIDSGAERVSPGEDPIVLEAKRSIDQTSPGELTPIALARRLQVSYPALRRDFKAATGYTLKEYMLRVQLRQAKELLAMTRAPIERVAKQLGFRDASYFTRLFRERVGIPPAAFRAQHATPTEAS